MELIEGVPLSGPLSQQESLRFASEICDALDYAQQRGIVHGDLKPSNVLVTHQGIKLLNFGLVHATSDIHAVRLRAVRNADGPPDQPRTAARSSPPRSRMFCTSAWNLMPRPVGNRRPS